MNRLILLLAAAGLLAAPVRAQGDRDVVSVNGTVIRQSEVMERLWKEYGPATLDDMVNEILMRQAAKAQGIKADDAEVDKRLARLRAQFTDAAMFENQLKQNGTTVEKLRAHIADEVVMRKLIVSTQRVTVKEDELKKAFQQQREKLVTPPAVHLRHILVRTEAEANEIIQKVKGGADFMALARERSLAPTGKLNGGDYGFVSRGMLPDEIDRIAFAMKAGELRSLSSAQGFHILQVVEKRPAKPAQYEAVKEDLRDILLAEKMKSVLPGYLQGLRSKADIKPLGKP